MVHVLQVVNRVILPCSPTTEPTQLKRCIMGIYQVARFLFREPTSPDHMFFCEISNVESDWIKGNGDRSPKIVFPDMTCIHHPLSHVI